MVVSSIWESASFYKFNFHQSENRLRSACAIFINSRIGFVLQMAVSLNQACYSFCQLKFHYLSQTWHITSISFTISCKIFTHWPHRTEFIPNKVRKTPRTFQSISFVFFTLPLCSACFVPAHNASRFSRRSFFSCGRNFAVGVRMDDHGARRVMVLRTNRRAARCED